MFLPPVDVKLEQIDTDDLNPVHVHGLGADSCSDEPSESQLEISGQGEDDGHMERDS